MKHTKLQGLFKQGVLKSVGLLGVGAVLGIATPTIAAPRGNDVRQERRDVKQARKEVKQERHDVRRANTPQGRRDAREDLRDAKGDLRDERQEYRGERRDDRTGANRTRGNSDRWDRGNRATGTYYGIPRGSRNPVNVRPNIRPNANTYRNLEGIVTNDLDGNDFLLRTTSGQQIRVLVQSGEPGQISRGDRVRAYGFTSNGTFLAQNLSILANR